MHGLFTETVLRRENEVYKDTPGVSANNVHRRFLPAFKDMATGEVCLSLKPDGSPCSIHILDGLPEAWIIRRNDQGHVTAIKDSVIAGFVRNGRFYSRQELAKQTAGGDR
jgi:hypothetical protein